MSADEKNLSAEGQHEAIGKYAAEMGHPEFPDAIPGFSDFGHIPFEGLPNTRDLGGMPAADGRHVVPARLIRSGALHKATDQDLNRLLGDYELAGVIDLRTEMERDGDPDPKEKLPGVVFYDFPAVAGETIGITHGAGLAADLKTFAGFNADPHEVVMAVYPKALLEETGRRSYGSLLEVLLEAEDGAYLWHCTEGKDRAGMGALIVERALGVPEEFVKRDYLATNLFARTKSESWLDAVSDKLHILRGIDADVDSLFYAFSDYYDCAMEKVHEAYGSFDAYLEKGLNFGAEKQKALRDKYLQ